MDAERALFVTARARWLKSRRRTAGIVAALTWLFAVLTIVSALSPGQRDRIHDLTQVIPTPASAIATAITLGLGVVLLHVAHGLHRRKRRAWRIAVGVTAVLVASHVLKGLDLEESMISAAMLALLVVSRGEFYAVGDRVGRWYTTRICIQLILLDIVLGMALLTVNRGRIIGHPSLLTQLDHVVLGLAGFHGPLQFRGDRLPDIVTAAL